MEGSRRRKRQVKRFLRKVKLSWIIKGILYILGIYAFFYTMHQYEITLISISSLLTIGITGGILVSLILERKLKYYLFSIILFGSLCTAVFFWINREFSGSHEIKLHQRILYKALASPKVEHSRVTIAYDNYMKDIGIAHDEEYNVDSASFIILTVHRGGLGHYIISGTELAK
ncbi:MAG TPA: hypothetical protein VHC47_06020 [Mucilaginibacter sp.]|nr:hypothetical protein [Mucilaginibacter sp.]